tara:strand:- start:46 stop:537 length:492 start_codon:yes stop_codon:yes gene_type:complete
MKKKFQTKNSSNILRLKIRELCSLKESKSTYFSKQEIITILKTIDPNLQIIKDKEDDPDNFVNCDHLFEYFLTELGIWDKQETVSNQPILENLKNIHKALVSSKIKKTRELKSSRKILEDSVVIDANYGDIVRIFNSLPSWVPPKVKTIVFEGKNDTKVTFKF